MAELIYKFWFDSPNLSVPINIDVNFFGARYMDSFCWSLCSDYSTVDEFAWQTCQDMNLPSGFRHRIALQIIEQLDSYNDLLLSAKFCTAYNNYNNTNFINKFKIPLIIDLCIRKDIIEYTDKFTWNLLLPISPSSSSSNNPIVSSITSPEKFAHTTVLDLGLPIEMEPMITYKIREALFRHLIQCIQEEVMADSNTSDNNDTHGDMATTSTTIDTTTNTNTQKDEILKIDSTSTITIPPTSTSTTTTATTSSTTTTTTATTTTSTNATNDKEIPVDYPKVRLCSQTGFFNAITDTYKKLKPGYVQDVTTTPHALLPENQISNAQAWQ